MNRQPLLTPLARQLAAGGLLALALPMAPALAQDAAPAAAGAASAPAAEAPAPATPARLQEVVVTAQKVRQPASKTPVALTVVGGEELRAAGVTDARGLTDVAPGVQIGQESGKAQIAIRGVVSLDMTEKGDPSAAFNVDGAYIARPEAQLGSFMDLERVEVLRGPQGTLYGRNATAGAVNLITNKPTQTFGGSVGAEVGNYGRRSLDATLNVPLSEVWAARAAVSKTQRDTYLKPGPNSDIPLESQDDHAARLHLLGKFSPDTSLLLTAETSHNGGGGSTPVPIGNFFEGTYTGRLPFSPAGTGNNIANPKYVDRGTTAQLTAGLPFAAHDARRDDDNTALRAEFRTGLSFAEFTYQLAMLKTEQDDVQNGSYFGFPFEGRIRGDSKSVSHELRLNSLGQGPLRWVAGAYLFDESIDRDTQYNTFITAPFGAFTVNVPFLPHIENQSKALFGQMTYALVPATRLTLGLRVTQDQKSGRDPLAGTAAPTGQTSSSAAYTAKVKFSNTSWKVGVEHDLDRRTMVYGHVATGYKAGGFNDHGGSSSYKPENLTAYEGGIKGRFLGDALQLSLGAFHYDYRDLQLNSVVCTSDSPDSCGSLTTNAANATVDGAEAEGKLRVGDFGVLRFGLSLNQAKFKTYRPTEDVDFSGQRLDRAPAQVLSLGYSHAFVLGDGAELLATVGTRLNGSYMISDPAEGIRYTQPAFRKSDASLGYTSATGKYSAQLYVKNIENEVTLESRVPGAFAVGDPRTYGLRLGMKF
ncbi:TonB-dependent receptor [Ideonella livida]|uniref:TonB-dependent receptor n=1 Tax=Ideonella livida TaxID=2707176 RepID=A0A7C9TKM7_9BURK|nr:TonB-dependent receptor [Ideonella livida]NDY91884.1 TonB-dependent receptor [Ideonella livida]